MPYSEYLPRAVPPWMGRAVGAAYWTKVGALFDLVRDRMVQALLTRFPSYAPSDGLDEIGRDRGLPRLTSESDATFLARLKAAWTTWGPDDTPLTGVGGGGGTHLTMLKALAALGLPTGTTGITIVQQNGRYSQLVSGALSLGTLMNCVNRRTLAGTVPGNLPGWTFEGRDTFWSEFGVLFPVDVSGLTVGSLLASNLNREVTKWKPSKGVFVGTWVIQSGRTLGWPTGRTLGTDPNLGGNTIRYIPPPGGNRIGYTP